MEELFTETALVHGVAGFTTKSGRQAAVETVADPERERIRQSWEAVTAAQAREALWAILAKRSWTSERVLPLLKSSRASFWRKACAVGLCDRIVLARYCITDFNNPLGQWNHVIIFACHACRSA